MDDFLREMSKAMRICGFFGAVSFAGFFALGKQYYSLWLPSQNATMLHTLTMITIFNYITDSILRPVYYVNTLTLKNKTPCFVTIAGGFLNVASMYFLLKYTDMGAYAVVITTAVIMVAINMVFNPIYAAKCLSINPIFFYKILLKHIIATVAMVIVFSGLGKILAPTSWFKLIISALIMVPFSAVVAWTFGEKIGNGGKKILWQSGKIAFGFSISIEMLQLLLRLGTFQLSDIFYNTVGGVLGGLMYCAVMKVRKRL